MIDRDVLRIMAANIERQKYDEEDDAMDALVAYIEAHVNEAYEAAAKVCDHQADRARTSPGNARADACARNVRKLKNKKEIYDHGNY